MEVGAVAAMRYVKDGIRAARLVMLHTEHTMLVGDQASAFAISMGLSGPTNLSSTESLEKWNKWKESRCLPNFRKNVLPVDNCGPYQPKETADLSRNRCLMANSVETITRRSSHVGVDNHDTIAMAAIDNVSQSSWGTFLMYFILVSLVSYLITATFLVRWDTLLLVHLLMEPHLRSPAGT